MNRAAREVLHGEGFVEIETPTLTRSTPEGARDFLVPARLQPGSWYALPQSPQLFKQLLMVAGMERYFQIARCYRDEDFRADRQPEFTQLDIEMSFVEQDDVIALAEDVLQAVWKLIGHDVPTPIPRMTYAEAMARYGSDKPDLRVDLELTECTEYFADTPFRVFQAPYVGAVVMPGGASQPRKQLDAWQDWAKQRGAKGLAYVLVQEDGELGGPVAKNLSEDEKAGLAAHVGAKPGDCVFFAAGPVKSVARPAGRRPPRDRPALRPDRRVGLELPVGRRRAAVRARRRRHRGRRRRGRQRRLDRGAPRLHLAQAGVPGHLRHRARRGAGLRLRHRLQRQRDRRRLHPYPPRGRPEAGVRGDGALRGGGRGEVRLPARRRSSTAPRRTAASPSAWDRICALLAGTDSIRDVIAFPKTGGGLRPAHRGAGADHAGAAQGGRRGRRPAPQAPPPGPDDRVRGNSLGIKPLPRLNRTCGAGVSLESTSARGRNVPASPGGGQWTRGDRPRTRKVTMGTSPRSWSTSDVHADDVPGSRRRWPAGRRPRSPWPAGAGQDRRGLHRRSSCCFILIAVFAPLI